MTIYRGQTEKIEYVTVTMGRQSPGAPDCTSFCCLPRRVRATISLRAEFARVRELGELFNNFVGEAHVTQRQSLDGDEGLDKALKRIDVLPLAIMAMCLALESV